MVTECLEDLGEITGKLKTVMNLFTCFHIPINIRERSCLPCYAAGKDSTPDLSKSQHRARQGGQAFVDTDS